MRFLRVLLIIIVLLAVVYGVLAVIAKPRSADDPFMLALPPGGTVLAHAGGNLLWPDNTMRAFLGSAELGSDVLELDVQRDKDGVFMVIHDATVDRTTDGSGAVATMTNAELARLDAGYNWTVDGTRADPPADASFPYRDEGINIPTLSEVLTALPSALVNIEIKEDDAAAGTALCELLRGGDFTDRVMVASFHSSPLRAFRADCPAVATSASRQEVTVFFVLATARLAAIYSPPFDAVQVPQKQGNLTVTTPHFVKAAHSRGVAVQVWTVNDRADMDRLLAMGVDGLITDRPDRALSALGRTFPADAVPLFVQP